MCERTCCRVRVELGREGTVLAMAMPVHHRQGDVLFVRCEALPADVRKQASPIIVAGETTGHAHRLATGDVMTGPHGELFVRVTDANTLVTHEEHAPITLEAGVWQVVRQREYTPAAIRRVAD